MIPSSRIEFLQFVEYFYERIPNEELKIQKQLPPQKPERNKITEGKYTIKLFSPNDFRKGITTELFLNSTKNSRKQLKCDSIGCEFFFQRCKTLTETKTLENSTIFNIIAQKPEKDLPKLKLDISDFISFSKTKEEKFGKFLSCTIDGKLVDLWHCDDNSNRQKWEFENISKELGISDAYLIKIHGGTKNKEKKYLTISKNLQNYSLEKKINLEKLKKLKKGFKYQVFLIKKSFKISVVPLEISNKPPKRIKRYRSIKDQKKVFNGILDDSEDIFLQKIIQNIPTIKNEVIRNFRIYKTTIKVLTKLKVDKLVEPVLKGCKTVSMGIGYGKEVYSYFKDVVIDKKDPFSNDALYKKEIEEQTSVSNSYRHWYCSFETNSYFVVFELATNKETMNFKKGERCAPKFSILNKQKNGLKDGDYSSFEFYLSKLDHSKRVERLKKPFWLYGTSCQPTEKKFGQEDYQKPIMIDQVPEFFGENIGWNKPRTLFHFVNAVRDHFLENRNYNLYNNSCQTILKLIVAQFFNPTCKNEKEKQ